MNCVCVVVLPHAHRVNRAEASLRDAGPNTELFEYGLRSERERAHPPIVVGIRRGIRTNSVCPSPIDTPLLKDFRATMTDKVKRTVITGRRMKGPESPEPVTCISLPPGVSCGGVIRVAWTAGAGSCWSWFSSLGRCGFASASRRALDGQAIRVRAVPWCDPRDCAG